MTTKKLLNALKDLQANGNITKEQLKNAEHNINCWKYKTLDEALEKAVIDPRIVFHEEMLKQGIKNYFFYDENLKRSLTEVEIQQKIDSLKK